MIAAEQREKHKNNKQTKIVKREGERERGREEHKSTVVIVRDVVVEVVLVPKQEFMGQRKVRCDTFEMSLRPDGTDGRILHSGGSE